MAHCILYKPVNPLMAQQHNASINTAAKPDSLLLKDDLPSQSDEKAGNSMVSNRVPPGVIVAKSFDEEGQPAVEELFDCRTRRVIKAKKTRAPTKMQEKAECGYEGMRVRYLDVYNRADGMIRHQFPPSEGPRQRQSPSCKNELVG